VQHPVPRTIILVLAILLSAAVFTLAIQPSMSLRGIAGPTIQLAQQPLRALMWTLACYAGCVAIGCVVARLINAVVGLFVVGCGVAMLAMQSGTIESLVFGGGQLSSTAVETFAWALLVFIASVALFRVGGPLPDAVPIDDPRVDGPFGVKGLVAQLAGVLVLVAVLLVAVTSQKGQALGAVVLGGMLVGVAGRLFAPRTPPLLLFTAPVFFGGLGQLIAHFLLPANAKLDAVFIAKQLSHLAYPMPIDFAAGSLIGVALGIGWSRSFIKTEVVTTDGAALKQA